MKPFDQWVDDIAASNKETEVYGVDPGHEDSELTTDCEGGICQNCKGKGYLILADFRGNPYQEDCEWCMEIICSGSGCSKTGKANYSDNRGEPLYYCGGSPFCCP